MSLQIKGCFNSQWIRSNSKEWLKQRIFLFFLKISFSYDNQLELSKSVVLKKDRENQEKITQRNWTYPGDFLKYLCAFEPITCYQDHAKVFRIHYIFSGMRYIIVLLGEAQHFENGEIIYRSIAEIYIKIEIKNSLMES